MRLQTYFREKVEEMKIIQKLRERATGVNVVGLALGENVTSDVMTVGICNIIVTQKVQRRNCTTMKNDLC